MPPELLDLILSWHMPICAQQFTGNPNYTLYWCYSRSALREILGMTRDQYKVVESSLGKFMRRVPKTSNWLTTFQNPQTGGWAFNEHLCGDGGLQTSEPRSVDQAGGLSSRLAAARRQVSQKSFVGLPPP